jgi:hypothetical protein
MMRVRDVVTTNGTLTSSVAAGRLQLDDARQLARQRLDDLVEGGDPTPRPRHGKRSPRHRA